MPSNQFLPFATGAGANALTFAQYSTQGYLGQGFQNGVAQPYDINTVLRQTTTGVSGLAAFIADNQPADVLDDGIPVNFENKLKAALTNLVQSVAPKAAAQVAYGATSEGGLAVDASNDFLLNYSNLNGGLGFAASDVLAFRRAADGALLAGTMAQLAALMLSTIIASGTFQQVVVNQTLYVRSDGNDSNNGLANTAAGAYATPQAAINGGLGAYSFASGTLKIKLGIPGTYAAPTTIPRASGVITIEGDIANQAGYVLTGSAGSNALVTATGLCVLNGLTISSTSTSLHVFAVGAGANAALNNVTLAAANGTSGSIAFCVGGLLQFNAGCILSGSAASACDSDSGGSISVNSNTVLQIVGNPSFSAATVVATNESRFTLQGGASFSGSASGPRYLAVNYSTISVNGGGPNAIPGSSAGSTSNGIYG